MSIIIYGPPGCGKSLNKENLALLFNRHNIVDNYIEGIKLSNDSIAFTNQPDIVGNHIIPYDLAMELYQKWISLVRLN